MRDPTDILEYKSVVMDALNRIHALLLNYSRCEQMTTWRFGPSYPSAISRRFNPIALALIQEASSDAEKCRRYRSMLEHGHDDLDYAAVFAFLKDQLICSVYRIKGFRPSLAIKLEAHISNLRSFHELKKSLEVSGRDGVYFYADFQPYAALAELPQFANEQESHSIFDGLVDFVQAELVKRCGWLRDFRGTDTVLGFIPEIEVALRFLLVELRVLTRTYLSDSARRFGWNIGAALGSSRELLGHCIPVAAVGKAAKYVELAEEAKHVAGGSATILCERLGPIAQQLYGPALNLKEYRNYYATCFEIYQEALGT